MHTKLNFNDAHIKKRVTMLTNKKPFFSRRTFTLCGYKISTLSNINLRVVTYSKWIRKFAYFSSADEGEYCTQRNCSFIKDIYSTRIPLQPILNIKNIRHQVCFNSRHNCFFTVSYNRHNPSPPTRFKQPGSLPFTSATDLELRSIEEVFKCHIPTSFVFNSRRTKPISNLCTQKDSVSL